MHLSDPRRYSRHVALPQIGEAGQDRLRNGSALIVGLGGLGSVASLYLANAGIGRLVINDFDRVDVTNRPRQILFTAQDVGEFKTHASAESLKRVNLDTAVTVLNRRLADDELADAARGCDLVLDCCDNFATRVRVNAACVAAGTPLVSGAAIRFEGQVAVFGNQGGEAPCYRCLYGEDDENLGDCAGQGVLAPVAGTVGSIMATEAIKLLAGIGSGLRERLWIYDALNGATRLIRIQRNPACPAPHRD